MYELNTQSARAAETFGSYLSESGKYIGALTRAENLTSKKTGAHGVGLTFECSKQTARFDLWTANADWSQHYSGMDMLNAIMTCLSLSGIRPSIGSVVRRNYDTKQDETVQAEIFADLIGKPLGVVLQKVEYEKMKEGRKTGETAWKLEPYAIFRAADEFTAAEILDCKTQPEKLSDLIGKLKDRPLRTRPAAHGNDGFAASDWPPAGGASGGFDSDIPF